MLTKLKGQKCRSLQVPLILFFFVVAPCRRLINHLTLSKSTKWGGIKNFLNKIQVFPTGNQEVPTAQWTKLCKTAENIGFRKATWKVRPRTIFCGVTIWNSWASPLAAVTRTIRELVLFNVYLVSLYGISIKAKMDTRSKRRIIQVNFILLIGIYKHIERV